jgi:hypothetical protein
MNKPKFTPGPWEVLWSEGLDSVAVARKDDMSLPFAKVYKDQVKDNRLENAKLIAAAPYMLDGLLEIKALLQDGQDAPLGTIENIIDDCIKKARWEE